MAKLSQLIKIKISVIEQSKTVLRFSYRAVNFAERDVYAFNLLPPRKKGQAPEFDPHRVYAQIDGATLVTSKRLIEVPEGIDVLAPEVPFLTQILPGEALEETVTLDIPVHEDFPYKRPRPKSQPEHICNSLVFMLGFLVPLEARWLRRAVINDQALFVTDYGFAIQMNLVASSEPVPISIECFGN